MTTAILDMPVPTGVQPSALLSLPTMPSRTTVEAERVQALQIRLTHSYESIFADLKEDYQIQDEGRVFAFLRQHKQLIPVLQEGCIAANFLFGEKTPILLTLRRDPEVGLEYLIAWIQTSLPPSEAVERLFEFADAWYLDQVEIVGDLLNYNLGVL